MRPMNLACLPGEATHMWFSGRPAVPCPCCSPLRTGPPHCPPVPACLCACQCCLYFAAALDCNAALPLLPRIADGPLRIELSRTLVTDVPGVAFGVRADAFKHDDASPVEGAPLALQRTPSADACMPADMLDVLKDLRIDNPSGACSDSHVRAYLAAACAAGTTVDVSLVPRNGSASLAGCSEAARASVSQQRCSIKAGDPASVASCQLRLPCAGDFVLQGCVGGGGGCSRPIRLGRNATSWASAPWSSGPGQLRLLGDRQNVSEGANLTLYTQNPLFGPTSALLVWGDGELREQRVLPEVRGVVASPSSPCPPAKQHALPARRQQPACRAASTLPTLSAPSDSLPCC